MEEVKTLDLQPRRTLRRMGSGMLGQPPAEQGRSHGVAIHSSRQVWYKHVGAKSTPLPGEKSEGDILLLDGADNITAPEGRSPTSTKLSEE